MSGASGSPAHLRAVLGAGAVALALAIGAVAWMTRTGAPAVGGESAAAAAASPASAPGTTGLQAPLAVPASQQDGAAASVAPSSVEGWSSVPMAARLSDLGPLARPVYDGLRKARVAMDPCFLADDEEQAAHPRVVEEGAWGAAILTLQLEGRPGELVVVNAPLQELGTSSPSLVECCEGVLRGFRIPAPAATPGKRYRVQHQLTR